MAPSITPSPHRFLPALDRHTATATNTSPNQGPGSHITPNPVQHPKSSKYGSSQFQGSSQFAAKPRFAGPKSPITQQPIRSPKTKKDRVEEFDDESVISGLEKDHSPLLGSVKRPRGRERIDESWDDFEGDAASSAMYGVESQSLMPSTRKRKIPLPPAWSTTAIKGDANGHQSSPSRHVAETGTSAVQSKQDVSTAVSPLLTNIVEQPLVSPRLLSSVSPSHAGRNIPRFDFSKLTERTANKLQKVTGTGQFIFGSMPGGDSHGEALSLENTNLTLLFSPQKHRKYQYAPGGLAATVRDWVLDAAAGIGSSTTVVTFRVLTVEVGERGSRMVCGVDKHQEEGRYLLLGEPRGLRNTVIVKGSWIAVMDPSWKVELEEVWTVAVNWKVIEAGDV